MNGKTTDNATFLHGATRGRPGKTLSEWQKKPHIHRALIRGAVFWPTAFVLFLAVMNRGAALLALAFMAFPVAWLTFRKGRLIFFQPFASTDAPTGIRTQHWMLRNKWRRLLRRQPIPGLVTKRDKFDPKLPEEMQEAIAASLNMNELKGEPPVLPPKVTRYRRDR